MSINSVMCMLYVGTWSLNLRDGWRVRIEANLSKHVYLRIKSHYSWCYIFLPAILWYKVGVHTFDHRVYQERCSCLQAINVYTLGGSFSHWLTWAGVVHVYCVQGIKWASECFEGANSRLYPRRSGVSIQAAPIHIHDRRGLLRGGRQFKVCWS